MYELLNKIYKLRKYIIAGAVFFLLAFLLTHSSYRTDMSLYMENSLREFQSKSLSKVTEDNAEQEIVLKKTVGEIQETATLKPYKEFYDVDRDKENWTAVNYLSTKGIISGYPDGSFLPDKKVSRAELIKILVAAHGINPPMSRYNSCFIDVKTQWFAPYVCYAKERGWVHGYFGGGFKPLWEINRAEAAKVILLAFDVELTTSEREQYREIKRNKWYSVYSNTLRRKNLFDAGVTFKPRRALKREEAAEIIFRVLVMKEQNAERYTVYRGKTMGTSKTVQQIAASHPMEQKGFKASAPKVMQDFQILYNSKKEAIQSVRGGLNYKKDSIDFFKRNRHIGSAEYYTFSSESHPPTGDLNYTFLIVNISGKENIHVNIPIHIWKEFKKSRYGARYYENYIKGRYPLNVLR